MNHIFINLKRFDVPESYGGICPYDNPAQWIQWVIDESIRNNLGQLDGIDVIYVLPESLLLCAAERLKNYSSQKTSGIYIGCQGVFREDVKMGGNFGAFSTNLPAAAAKAIGCSWVMIGHSEERWDKMELIGYLSNNSAKINKAVNDLLNKEIHRVLERNINVLLCVGETAEERGTGCDKEQRTQVKKVLKDQILMNLKSIGSYVGKVIFVIAYEPIWAIGPGKTPPGKDYISFISSYIKDLVAEYFDFNIPVVYGGGLKESNAPIIASIDTIDGGLIALTTFTDPPGFEPHLLKKIIDAY